MECSCQINIVEIIAFAGDQASIFTPLDRLSEHFRGCFGECQDFPSQYQTPALSPFHSSTVSGFSGGPSLRCGCSISAAVSGASGINWLAHRIAVGRSSPMICRVLDGFYDVFVAGAAAKVALFQGVPNLRIGGLRILFEQPDGGHSDAPAYKTHIGGHAFPKSPAASHGLLAIGREPFDRHDLGAAA